MVTIDALDRFVHTLSGNVFHIEFDRCGNGRLSVYADTWERILCHHAEGGANTRSFPPSHLAFLLISGQSDEP